MELLFYPQGIIRRQHDERGVVETPLAAEDLARVLAGVQKPVTWNTGILSTNTLLVGEQFGGRLIIEYRPPQMTGLWLEGSEEPVRIPLPGLVLLRHLSTGERPSYRLYAVKRRPKTDKTKLYQCPLPNTYSHGGICWGTVAAPTADKLQAVTLEADWAVLIGSRFGDHVVNSKSRKHPKDIRKMLLEIEAAKATAYPLDDLQLSGTTFGEAVKKMGDPHAR